MKKAGWVNASKLPTGPNGRALCRLCQEEVPKGRRTFCSDICVKEWRIRNDSNYQAKVLFDRDRGICSECGCNTEKEKAEFWEKIIRCRRSAEKVMWADNPDWKIIRKAREECEGKVKKEYRAKGWNVGRMRWWDVHHKQAISEGGDPDNWPRDKTYLDNLVSICVPCHKKETKSLRARLKNMETKDGKGNKRDKR